MIVELTEKERKFLKKSLEDCSCTLMKIYVLSDGKVKQLENKISFLDNLSRKLSKKGN